jgi:hypothetical protein
MDDRTENIISENKVCKWHFELFMYNVLNTRQDFGNLPAGAVNILNV